jgi:hypothetical protein
MAETLRSPAPAGAQAPRKSVQLDSKNGSEHKATHPAKQARRLSARVVKGERSELAIYAGRDCCGFIRPSGDAFLLLDVERRTVGVFPSLREALQALGGAS